MPLRVSYDIFFTGSPDDPRHNCVMIGYLDDTNERPFYLCFETPEIPTSETVTTIYKDNRRPIASFEWTARNYMGMATIGGRRIPMANLVQPGPDRNVRKFVTTDGRTFEWRRAAMPNSGFRYDLHSGPNIPSLATFTRFAQLKPSDAGPSYAFLNCRFDDETLLIESSLALCLNRWIDFNYM